MSTVIKNIPFVIDFAKLRRTLMIDNQKDKEKLLEMIAIAEQLANPRASYREVYISEKGDDYLLIDNIKLSSRLLRINLAEVDRAFIYIITVGQELDHWANKEEDILYSFWVDKLQEMILNSAVEFVYNKLERLLGSVGSSDMNPGSLQDWPIEEQFKIFSLLGIVKKDIGVELTNNFLMIPAKSISGIKFASKIEFKNCQLCQRKYCPDRKAAYDQQKKKKLAIEMERGDLY